MTPTEKTMNTDTTAPAFTVTVKRGRADRFDNRATKTYGVTLRWFADVTGLDPETMRHAANYSGRWGDDRLTQLLAAEFPENAKVRGNSAGWESYGVEVFFPVSRPRDIPGDPWTAGGGAAERRVRDVIELFVKSAVDAANEARTRHEASALVVSMMQRAREETDGAFEARFAALRAERAEARRAAFQRIAADARREAKTPAEIIATAPDVRATFAFGEGPFGHDRVYLRTDETPGEKRAEEATA